MDGGGKRSHPVYGNPYRAAASSQGDILCSQDYPRHERRPPPRDRGRSVAVAVRWFMFRQVLTFANKLTRTALAEALVSVSVYSAFELSVQGGANLPTSHPASQEFE